MKKGQAMKKEYVAPSLKVLGSLSDLTLRGKSIGTPNDGIYLFPGKISLTS
jgi:hypothetical protein